MSLIGSLAVSILGDDRELKKAFGSTEKQINRLEKKMYKTARSIGDMGKSMTTLITGPVVALGAGMFGLAEKTAAAGDEVQKMALRTGFSTEALSEFKHAAELSGTSLDGLENGVRRMQRSVLDLERGLATQTEAFAMLGLEIEDIQGLSPEQQFEKITMALADVEDESKQAALAQQIFGRSGTQLLPMLKQGSDGIREMREEAQELGIVFDQEAADQAAEFQDELTRLKAEFTGFIQQLGMELIPLFLNDLIPMFKETVFPVIRDLTEKVKGIIAWFSGLDTGMQKNIIKWTLLAAAIGPVLIIISKMIMVAKTFLPILKAIKIAMAAINAPTLAIVAAIGALIAVTVELVRNWQETKDAIVAVWDYLKASVNHLVISIQLAFEHMKWAVLAAVNFMLEKLSLLENIPYIGEKFKDLKNMISDGVDGSAEKIEELQKRAKESGDKLMDSFGEVGSSFGKLGGAIVDDVKDMVGSLTGFGKAANDAGEDAEELGDDVNGLEGGLKKLKKGADDAGGSITNLGGTLTDLEQEWTDKLFEQSATRLKKLEKEKEEAIAQAREKAKETKMSEEELEKVINDIKKYYANERQKIQKQEDDAEEQNRQRRLQSIEEFEQSWSNKVFEQSADRIKILEKEEKDTIQAAREKAAELEISEERLQKTIANIQLYYSNERQKIRDEEADVEEEKNNAMLKSKEEYINSWEQKVFKQTATEKELLEQQKQNAINLANEKAKELKMSEEELQKVLYNIKKYYAEKEKEIMSEQKNYYQEHGNALVAGIAIWKDNVVNYMAELKNNTAVASQVMAQSIVSFADTINVQGKSVKEAIKDMLLTMITGLEQQVIAQQVAGIATAWAQAPATFGASLAWIGQIVAAVAPALATFEAVKAVINQFKDGGLVTGPTLGLIGEAGDNEAVLPLNTKTFAGLAEGIVNQLSRMQMTPATAGAGAAGRISNVENNSQPTYNFYFPHAIDKAGTKKFVRNEVIPIITSENIRKGGN